MRSEKAASGTPAAPTPSSRRKLIRLVPLAVFLVLAGVFLVRLNGGGDPSALPSMLVGRPAPDLSLPPLDGVTEAGLSRDELLGHLTLVNVFASWCGPCREEHPILTQLAADPRIRLIGINYKDRPEDATRFLHDLGNPYKAIGVDRNGRAGIEWGVYGVPESFLVGEDGTIRYRFVGPLTPDSINAILKPEMERAKTTG